MILRILFVLVFLSNTSVFGQNNEVLTTNKNVTTRVGNEFEVAKNDIEIDGSRVRLTWDEAINACKKYYEEDGKTNWILPDFITLNAIYELFKIEKEKKTPFSASFNYGGSYWSSSPCEKCKGNQAWYHTLLSHFDTINVKADLYVRCVRAL